MTIVYLRNTRGALPPDAPRLRAYLKKTLHKPFLLHVAKHWISVKAFTDDKALVVRAAVEALQEPPLWSRIGEPPSCKPHLGEAYMGYVAANMFWEAHTVGEELWRLVGPAGRALAVAAGALAKAQEGTPGPAEVMLYKASIWAREAGASLDPQEGLRLATRVYREGWVDARPWLRPLLARALQLAAMVGRR